MTARVRKFLGMWILIFGLFAYIALVVTIGTSSIMPRHWALQLLFYLIAGIVWAIPLRPFMRWVNQPDPLPDVQPNDGLHFAPEFDEDELDED